MTLPRAISNIFVADDKVADVQVKSASQVYVFAKAAGETSIFATDRSGAVVWSSSVRVGNNIAGVGGMLRLAMPDADVIVTPMNGMVLLTGTVASPKDIEEAEHLTQMFTGGSVQVLNRLKTATPMQVNLQVKIAEVSRDLVKTIGVNLLSRDTTGGFLFGIAQGRNFGSIGDLDVSKLPTAPITTAAGTFQVPYNPITGQYINPIRPGTSYNLDKLGQGAGKTSFGLAGKFLGLDFASAIDLAENDGLVTTLAEPNLTALSGETASFLAGGEIPIPISQGLGAVSVEYKQYGVSLSFTPIVMSDGRISIRVRPEVSQLTSAGSVTLNGFTVPGVTTRRAETTVELGSGQSFMIGGLLNNNTNNSTDKVPGIGNLPILGALFRSNSFRRQQTELVIIVTPYLVKPVTASAIHLPTDGYKAPNDAERVLLGKTFSGTPAIKPPSAPSTPSAGGSQ